MLDGVVLVGEGDVERLGEVLAEVVRGAGLERAAILHHGLDAVGAQRAGELLLLGLEAADHRHGHLALGEIGVDIVQDHQRLALGVGLVGVDGMAFLPQKLGGAQKRPGAHLGAHHIGPLVDQQRQIAVAADPLGVEVADDRLAGRADDIGLGQLFLADLRDLEQLGGEPGDMLGLFHDEALGNQQREVGVLVAGILDPVIQPALDALPDRIAGAA